MSSAPTDPNNGIPRILVVAPMKSGGTYVASALSAYGGIPPLRGVDLDLNREHVVDHDFAVQLRGMPFCMNFHMLPTRFNIVACVREKIALIGLWRNLGDMLLSADDHQNRESGVHGPSGFSVIDPAKYAALDAQARYRFSIDMLTPWYLGFYLRWRRAGLSLFAYEEMVADTKAFFERILRRLFVAEPNVARLDSILARPAGADQRFNVGKVGRSAAAFSEHNKRHLEEFVLTHPEVAQLEILLWELPWDVPALAPRSALDGRVVVGADDPSPYFVSRGVAYPISASWLDSRAGARAQAQTVAPELLAALPRGEQLY